MKYNPGFNLSAAIDIELTSCIICTVCTNCIDKERMDYKRYQQIGCGIIGSGAIESAHRTVVQKRMKQSRQRWSVQGAQNMLNLRVTRKNLQWFKIVELTKSEFKTAA